MTAFEKLDWTRFDVHALINGQGIGVIDPARQVACRNWLETQGYRVEEWHFDDGIDPAVTYLGKRLRWEEQFGYALVPEPRNLDALRDGFISDEWGSEPFVLEVYEAERAWREDSRWFLGVLSIAMEHSLVQLALGHRFFVVLILERASRLIGREIERIWVPNIYRTAGRDFNA